MLTINNLNVYYGQIQALQDVSLKVESGQIVSLIGSNGAGKSTLMMTIAGILKPQKGSITLNGTPLSNEAHRIIKQGIILVPERRRLYANLTVKENLLMGAYIRKDKKEIYDDLKKFMEMFPIIRERFDQYAGTLSGGEQQMVAIARGLMGRPKLLLLDEPLLGLAPLIIEAVFEIIQNVRDQGTTIFMTEQNAFKALEISDYAYVLESGHNVTSGKGRDLLEDSIIKESYLGIKH